MGHGGARPGAGRPRGSRTKNRKAKLPLDYMLAIMRDPEAEPQRRDAMAIAALPYVHERIGAGGMGRKARADADAAEQQRMAGVASCASLTRLPASDEKSI